MAEIDNIIKEYSKKLVDSLEDVYVNAYLKGAKDVATKERKQSLYDEAVNYFNEQRDWIESHFMDVDSSLLYDKLDAAITEGQSFSQFWQSVEDSGMFDRTRAERIFRTETNRAYSEGTIRTYKEEGVKNVDILLGPEPCELCQEFADGGPYPTEDVEGVFPIHPNCSCVIVNSEFVEQPEEPEEPEIDLDEEIYDGGQTYQDVVDESDKLWKLTATDNKEHGIAFTKDGIKYVAGQENNVTIPLNDIGATLHTHPNNTSFSITDLNSLILSDKEVVSLLRTEDTIYIAKKVGDTSTVPLFNSKQLYDKADNIVIDAISVLAKERGISSTEMLKSLPENELQRIWNDEYIRVLQKESVTRNIEVIKWTQ